MNELLAVVTCFCTTMKISIIHTANRNINGTLFILTLIAPDTSMMEDRLFQTWVTVGIWMLIVITWILVDW